MNKDLAESIIESYGITELQDRVVLDALVAIIVSYQTMFGLSNEKLRKFLMIIAEFIELSESEKK